MRLAPVIKSTPLPIGPLRSRALSLAALGLTVGMLCLASSAPSALAAPSRPSVNGVYTSGVTLSTALLNAYINPRAEATTYYFQYGPTTAYGLFTSTAGAGSGSSEVKVSQAVAGLAPGTIYHYRILAANPTGTTIGPDHSFTTTKIPLSLQTAGLPNPVPYGEPFTLQGTLSGTGNAGRTVAMQTNPFPYLAGFKTVGNPVLTSSTGSFAFPAIDLLENTEVRVVTTATPLITSPAILERVAVRVTFHARRIHRRSPDRFYRLYGTVTPAEVGAGVGFQWLRPNSPSTNQGGTIVKHANIAVSSYSTIVRIRHRGVYQALVLVHDGSHVSAYSARLSIP
jgi:hypothetical protein